MKLFALFVLVAIFGAAYTVPVPDLGDVVGGLPTGDLTKPLTDAVGGGPAKPVTDAVDGATGGTSPVDTATGIVGAVTGGATGGGDPLKPVTDAVGTVTSALPGGGK